MALRSRLSRRQRAGAMIKTQEELHDRYRQSIEEAMRLHFDAARLRLIVDLDGSLLSAQPIPSRPDHDLKTASGLHLTDGSTYEALVQSDTETNAGRFIIVYRLR
jgi:hypothetical protein